MWVSTLLSRVFARRRREPAPYSVEWQLARALERIDVLEGEVRALYERRAEEARRAGNAVAQTAQGVEPFRDEQRVDSVTPDPPPHDLDAMRVKGREERAAARKRYSEMRGIPYEAVCQMDARGEINEIHNPGYWEMIDRRQRARLAEATGSGTNG